MAIGQGGNDPSNLPTTGGGTGPTYGGAGEVPPSLLNAMRGSLPGRYVGETNDNYWASLGAGPDYGAPFTNGNPNRPISYDASGNPTYAPYLKGEGTSGTRIAGTVLNQYGVATPGATPGADGTGSGGRPPPGAPMYYAGYQGGAAEEAAMASAAGVERAQGYMGMGATNYDQMGAMGRAASGVSSMIGNGWNATGDANQGGMAGLAGQYNDLSGYVYRGQADQDYAAQNAARLAQFGYGNAAGGAANANMRASSMYGRSATNDYGAAAQARQGQQAFGALGGNYGQTQFGTSQGLLGGAAQDYGNQQGSRGAELDAANQLQRFYQQGPGPSAAQAQLAQSTDQNMANAIALARSGRGAGDNSAAMRQAIFSNAATQQQAGMQAAQLRAQEAATWRGQQLNALGQQQSALGNIRGQDIGSMGQNLGSAAQFGGLGYQGIGLGAQQANTMGSQAASLYGTDINAQQAMMGLGYQGLGLGAAQANQARGQDLTALAQNNQTGLSYAQLGQGYQQMGLNNQLAYNQMANQNYMQGLTLQQQYQLAGMQNQINYAQLANQQYTSSDQMRAQILNAQLQADTAKYGADRGVQVGMAQIQQQQQAAQMAMYGALGAGAIGLLSDIRAKKNIRKPQGLLENIFGLADHGHGDDDEDTAPGTQASVPVNPYAAPPKEVPLPGRPSWEQGISPFAQQAPPPAVPPIGQDPRLQQQTIPIDFSQPPVSDERAKQAMYRLGQMAGMREAGEGPGIDLRPAQGYSYEYKNPAAPGAVPGRQYGPMAQDLEKTPAGASVVRTGADGMKSIDTDRLSLVNTAAQSESQRRLDRLEQLAGLRKAG